MAVIVLSALAINGYFLQSKSNNIMAKKFLLSISCKKLQPWQNKIQMIFDNAIQYSDINKVVSQFRDILINHYSPNIHFQFLILITDFVNFIVSTE